jgi:RNA polymerase sigma-70 factor (ECF subfamily)
VNSLSEDIVLAFRNGEISAFDQVFRHFFAPLAFYAFRLINDKEIAEDMVQDCFVDLWNRRHRLSHIGSIRSYLFRSVHNKVVSYIRKNKKRFGYHGEDAVAPAIDTLIVEAEVMAEILRQVNNLPGRMQEVLRLYYLEQKSYEEISDIIGISPETVRSHRYRAIQLLRKTIIAG